MSNARPDDSVRITVDVPNVFGERTIPAGAEGVVLEVRPTGAYLVDVTLKPGVGDEPGDYDQVMVRDGQFEIISSR